MSTAAKATNAVLWACLGLSLVSLAVLMLVFLLRKMSWEPLKDEFKHTGWFDGESLKTISEGDYCQFHLLFFF
jgi:hypothetical protein